MYIQYIHVHTYVCTYICTYVYMNIIYYAPPITWGLKKKSFQFMTYKMILHSKCGAFN